MSIVNAFPQYFPGEVQQQAQAAQHRLQTGQPAQQYQQAGDGRIDPQLYQYLQSVEQRLGAQQQQNEAHQMAQV
jgi:hypothetical protein